MKDQGHSVTTSSGHKLIALFSDVMKLVKIRIRRMRILTLRIRRMRIRIEAFILSVGMHSMQCSHLGKVGLNDCNNMLFPKVNNWCSN